jgi:putative ABC transport system permease protein
MHPHPHINPITMFRNYLLVAWRSLQKNKVFSFINIFGLSLGLTCCILISLYLLHETSYDSQHVNSSRLYQVGTTFIAQGKKSREPWSPAPLANDLQHVFPQIAATARIMDLYAEDKTLLQYHTPGGEARSYFEEKGFLADSGFFKLFTYNFIEGDPASAMNNPYSIVLSEEIARKMFASQPALNKIIHIGSSTNGDHDYRVTGVFRPSTTPSHIDGRFFLSLNSGTWGDYIRTTTNLANNNVLYTYLLLKPGADPDNLQSQFPAFVEKFEGKDLKAEGFYKQQFLIPVRDIHLHADTQHKDVTPSGSMSYLYILASIAVFILLIACINFMNLSTARFTKRSAEVGIRKTLGAVRSALIAQFLGEALLMTFIAFAVAFATTSALLPLFQSVAGMTLQLSNPQIILIAAASFGLAILTGLIAGSYPAFYLSSFDPVKVLKGKMSNSLAVGFLRKGLVVFQFGISVILIIASIVIFRQMKYMRQADLGFDRDRQIILPLRSAASKEMYTSFKDALEKDPRIISVGASAFYPGIHNTTDELYYTPGKSVGDAIDVKINYVDFDFLKTLQIHLLTGHLFSQQYAADSIDGVVLNETAVTQLGYTAENAIGKKFYNSLDRAAQPIKVIGVVRDFNFEDLHVPIGPYGFQVNSSFKKFNYAIVHTGAGDIGPTLAAMQNAWHKLDPDEPFEYNFLDAEFNKNYTTDSRLSSIVGYFTLIAICISCLGLFGLATFSAEQRTKEIGIRRVLGASATGIVTLLSADFLKLVGISLVAASPLAYYLMHRWLQNFAYKTTISWTVFAFTAVLALLIAVATISLQAIRAATANPAKTLRTE